MRVPKISRIKKIYANDGKEEWRSSHSQAPFPFKLDNGLCRLFFSVRDKDNRTRPTYIDFDMDKLEVAAEPKAALLDLGKPGCFDDCGVMPSCVVKNANHYLMYYTGWSVEAQVPYTLASGLAISYDLEKWEKYADGPIMSKSPSDPFYVTMPFVCKDGMRWRMWYTSGSEWQTIDGKMEANYNILKYASSMDGVEWTVRPSPLIRANTLITRPCIWKDIKWKMICSTRGIENFRTDKKNSYRLTYGESPDGVNQWETQQIDFEPSDNDWDSVMIAYGMAYTHNNQRFLFYNGNGFGTSGIGIASIE